MIKTAYFRNISTILGRPCLYRSALYWHWYHCAYAHALVQSWCGVNSLAVWNNIAVRCLNELSAILWRQRFLAGKYLLTRVCGGSLLWSWCRCGFIPCSFCCIIHLSLIVIFITFTYTPLSLFRYFLGLTWCFVLGFFPECSGSGLFLYLYNCMVSF